MLEVSSGKAQAANAQRSCYKSTMVLQLGKAHWQHLV